jgi:hypothetical protein
MLGNLHYKAASKMTRFEWADPKDFRSKLRKNPAIMQPPEAQTPFQMALDI